MAANSLRGAKNHGASYQILAALSAFTWLTIHATKIGAVLQKGVTAFLRYSNGC